MNTTYQQTLDWMFERLPMYQRQGNSAFKKDLTNIRAFSMKLGYPEKGFKSIHIGGTNGKGSTAHMMASVLQQAGYKTGLYTSPHLKDYRERIKINGQEISEKFVIDFIEKHRGFLSFQKLSFFEMSVGMAFAYFSAQQVDFAVIEVGLGGRLDSTNIITPILSVITNIGLDHTQFLGTTKKAIATEKAGIIKPSVPVVIGERSNETDSVFLATAKKQNAPIYFAEDKSWPDYELDLQGAYQQKNKQTLLAAVTILKEKGLEISEEKLHFGLQHVVKNTGLKGRWQILGTLPKIIADTAHNKEGLTEVLHQLAKEKYKKLHVVLGMVNDKNLLDILPLFPKRADYYFCEASIPRKLPVENLKTEANVYGLHGQAYKGVLEALNAACHKAKPDDLIFVGGSTFTVAEII